MDFIGKSEEGSIMEYEEEECPFDEKEEWEAENRDTAVPGTEERLEPQVAKSLPGDNAGNGLAKWLGSKLNKVHPGFIVAAIIAVIWIEFFMIPLQSYRDHPEMWIGLLIYLAITLVSVVILKYLFSIKFKTVFTVMTVNNLIFVIPIGAVISLITGYTLLQLFSPGWEFTHDFVYIMIVSQLAVTAILLFGIWWRGREKAVGEEGSGEAKDLESKFQAEREPASTMDIGTTSRTGRINGLSRGTGIGLTNGLGMTNGLTNGLGRTNGITNGLGMKNGLTNGLTRPAGKVNGLKPANSGLTNGIGALTGPSGRSGDRKRSLRKRVKRVAVPAIALTLIFLMLVLPPYLSTVFNPIAEGEPTRDWSNVTLFSDESETLNPNIDLIGYRALLDGKYLWTSMTVKGKFMGDTAPETNSALALIDLDRNSETGYGIAGIGADYLVKVYGHDGAIRETGLYEFGRTRSSNDWNGWIRTDAVSASISGNTLQTRTRLAPADGALEPLVFFDSFDSNGVHDHSETPIDLASGGGTLVVEQIRLADDVVGKGIVEIMNLRLIANGGSVTVDSINIAASQGGIVPLPLPIQVRPDRPESLTVGIDTTGLAEGSLIDVGLDSPDDVESSAALVSLAGRGVRAYVGTAPDTITIDGAFGDWMGMKDGPIGDDSGEPSNPNVDLTEYMTANGNADVFFYAKVEGKMMAGARIPALSDKYVPPMVSRAPPVSDGDGVNIRAGSQDSSPLPELTGEDGMRVFIDTDKNNATGYHPLHPFEFPVGADFMIEVKGSDGAIRSSALLRYRGESAPWDWVRIKEVGSECDETRLESGLALLDLGLASPVFDAYVHVADWMGDEDYSDSVLSQGLAGLESVKAGDPPQPDKNGGFGDGDIDVLDGGSCAGAFGCHDTWDNAQVPISISFNPAPPYNPGQTGIQIRVTINMNGAAGGSLAGVSVRVGPSGGAMARMGIENNGWVITNDPNGGTNNYIEKTGLVGAGATILTWTVTAPTSAGTYYIEATVWYDNGGAGQEHNQTSEQTITVIPEFPGMLFPILAMAVVFGVLGKKLRKVRP